MNYIGKQLELVVLTNQFGIIQSSANIPHMKNWRQFFQSVFIRHVVGPEPLSPIESIYQPMIGFDLIRFVLLQHFQFAKENEKFIVEYSEYQTLVMDDLRLDGYEVSLEVNGEGLLCYVIAADHSSKEA